jgi:hypothetical protein
MVASAPRWPARLMRTISSKRSMACLSEISVRRSMARVNKTGERISSLRISGAAFFF